MQQEAKNEIVNQETVGVDQALDDLFSSRKSVSNSNEPSEEQENETVEKHKVTDEKHRQKSKERTEIIAEAKPSEEQQPEKPEENSHEVKLKGLEEELSKARSLAEENRNYGRSTSRKIKNAISIATELLESGDITEDDANKLIEALKNEAPEHLKEEKQHDPYSLHPFGKLFKIADSELENIKKYSDVNIDDYVIAFNNFVSMGDKDEIENAFEDLTDLQDDPVRLTKKMLAIGKKYNDEVFCQVKDAGGFHKFIKKTKDNEDKLNKKIDNLSKKLSQYEDYNKTSYRIDSSSNDDFEDGKQSSDPLGGFFEKRSKSYS